MKKTFKQKWTLKIRKAHRYLVIFLGIQFIFGHLVDYILAGQTLMKYEENI